MFTTASLPDGSRLRAYLEQRVIYGGLFMTRAHALELQRKEARHLSTEERWKALDRVIALEHEPVDDDGEDIYDLDSVPPDPSLSIDELIITTRYATPTPSSLRA